MPEHPGQKQEPWHWDGLPLDVAYNLRAACSWISPAVQVSPSLPSILSSHLEAHFSLPIVALTDIIISNSPSNLQLELVLDN